MKANNFSMYKLQLTIYLTLKMLIEPNSLTVELNAIIIQYAI